MEEKPERKPTRWGLWLVVWVVSLIVYPFSSGPMIYLATHGYPIPSVCLTIIYWPVSALCRLVLPVAIFFSWYWNWWVRL